MKSRVAVPVRVVGTTKWGELSSLAPSHEICGEIVQRKNQNFSFAGEHRVRLYKFTKNVHWRIPEGVIELDISGVPPAQMPRRRQR
jgi:hypothetical protein